MTDKPVILRIGDFAKRAGTNLRTLRYYEELGLITPAQRSAGGFRLYDEVQLDRVAAIKRLQDLGLSLRQIQELLTGAARCSVSSCGGDELIDRVEHALDTQTELITARIATLRADLEELARAKTKLQACKTCDLQLSASNCDPCVHDQAPLSSVLRALL